MCFKDTIALNIAQMGFIGRSRHAPGTAGSFVALWLAPLFFLPLSLPLRCLVLVIVFYIGMWASAIAAKILNDKDPSSIIIDELVGQWIALLPVTQISYFGTEPIRIYQLFLLIIAFMLFRLFDITKVGPVGLAERKCEGAFGIMFDDVVAGLLAAAFMYPLNIYAHMFFYY